MIKKIILIILTLISIIGCSTVIIASGGSKKVKSIEEEIKKQEQEKIRIRNEKNKPVRYQYRLTERGKILIVPQTILFDENSDIVDMNKYETTINYVSSLINNPKIISMMIEGHIGHNESPVLKSLVYQANRTNNVLYLYNYPTQDRVDLSEIRAKNVENYIQANVEPIYLSKIKILSLQDLIAPYFDESKNRRVEFIIMENEDDIQKYLRYIDKAFNELYSK